MIESTTHPLTDADRKVLEYGLKTRRARVEPQVFTNRDYLWAAWWDGVVGLLWGLIPAAILYQFTPTCPYAFALEAIIFVARAATSPRRTAREREREDTMLHVWHEREMTHAEGILESGTLEVIHVTAYGTVEIASATIGKSPWGEFLIDVGDGEALFLRGDYEMDFVEAELTAEELDSTPTEWRFDLEQPLFYDVRNKYRLTNGAELPPITRIVQWRNREASEAWANGQVLDGVSIHTLEFDFPMLFKKIEYQ